MTIGHAVFQTVKELSVAPSDEGAGFCEAKDWGRDSLKI